MQLNEKVNKKSKNVSTFLVCQLLERETQARTECDINFRFSKLINVCSYYQVEERTDSLKL